MNIIETDKNGKMVIYKLTAQEIMEMAMSSGVEQETMARLRKKDARAAAI